MGEDSGLGESWRSRRMRDDPELVSWVEDDGNGFEAGGSDEPEAAE